MITYYFKKIIYLDSLHIGMMEYAQRARFQIFAQSNFTFGEYFTF